MTSCLDNTRLSMFCSSVRDLDVVEIDAFVVAAEAVVVSEEGFDLWVPAEVVVEAVVWS